MLSINHVTLFEPFDSVVCLLIFYLNEGLNVSPAEKSTSTKTDATFWELSRELFGVATYYNGVAIHFSEQKKTYTCKDIRCDKWVGSDVCWQCCSGLGLDPLFYEWQWNSGQQSVKGYTCLASVRGNCATRFIKAEYIIYLKHYRMHLRTKV